MSAQPVDVLPACTPAEAAIRVNRWWRASRGGINLGFGRRTVLGRVIEEGAQGASHERVVQPAPWMSPSDEQVDRIIAKMPRELRAAVLLDQDARLPMKVMCAKLNAAPGQVRRWIEGGYGFVAGALTVEGWS